MDSLDIDSLDLDGGSLPALASTWSVDADGAPVLSLTEASAEITVDGPIYLDASVTLALADLQAGPVAVVPPSWTGPAAPEGGDWVARRPAVWAYLDGDRPSIVGEWMRGTVEAPGDPYSWARPPYTFLLPVWGETDAGVIYRETATNVAGTRTAAVQVVAPA